MLHRVGHENSMHLHSWRHLFGLGAHVLTQRPVIQASRQTSTRQQRIRIVVIIPQVYNVSHRHQRAWTRGTHLCIYKHARLRKFATDESNFHSHLKSRHHAEGLTADVAAYSRYNERVQLSSFLDVTSVQMCRSSCFIFLN